MTKLMNISPIIIALLAIISTFIIGIDISYYPFIKEDYYFIITSSFLIALFLIPLLFRKSRFRFNFNLLDLLVVSNFLFMFIRALFSTNFYFVDPKFMTNFLCVSFYYLIRNSLSHPDEQAKIFFIRVLLVGFISLGLFQAILGVLQLLKILPLSLPDGQLVYGTFYNSGIYSNFLALVFPIALIGSFIFQRGLKVYSIFTCLVLLVVVFFSKGRTSWIAIIVSSSLIIGFNNYQFIKNKLSSIKTSYRIALGVFIISLAISSCLGLYHFKKDSADGRLLIWEISLKAFSEKPFLGHGFNSYQYAFNEAKYEFFSKENVDEKKIMLTGTTFTAFNEFIQILVEYGIIGLLLFVVLILITLNYILQIESKKMRILCLSLICSFIVISSFSYPFRIVTIQFIFYIALALVASNVKNIRLPKKQAIIPSNYLLMCLVFFLLFINISYVQIINASLKWKNGHDILLENQDTKGFHFFNDGNNKLFWNPNFLFNYGCNLLQFQKPDSAIIMLERTRLFRNDNSVYMMLGEAYETKGDYVKSLKCYEKASTLVPYLITPLFRQFQIYRNQNNNYKALVTASVITNIPIKIYNSDALKMKSEALLFINLNILKKN